MGMRFSMVMVGGELPAGVGGKRVRGGGGKVLFALGHGGILARDPDRPADRGFDRDLVGERERHHEGFEFVEAVGAASENPEMQIDFRRGAQLHGASILRNELSG